MPIAGMLVVVGWIVVGLSANSKDGKDSKTDPTVASAYADRGSAYYNKGENDRAIADCTEAIRLDPRASA